MQVSSQLSTLSRLRLSIFRADVKRVFDPTIQEVIALLQEQMDTITKQGKRLNVCSLAQIAIWLFTVLLTALAVGSRWRLWRFELPVLRAQEVV